MKKISLDVWLQSVGMLSVLAGLVFVGLELRQSQLFALAAQQTARMEVFVDAVSTFSETGVNFQDFQANGISEENETLVENFMHQLWWIHENDFLQYNLGLMDESIWEAKLRAIGVLYNGLGIPALCERAKLIWDVRRPILDPELVALVESIPENC
jgi:hypothetical protein